MKSPKERLADLERARAAHERALRAVAKSWAQVAEALEALGAARRRARWKHSPEWKAKNSAAIKHYWAEASPEQRAYHGERISEGLRRAAEKRKARWKPAA